MATPPSSRPSIRRKTLALTAALAALAAAVSAPAAQAITGEQAVAALNGQRAASGIPANIVHNPEWSRWCALHNNYQRINRTLTHDESPSAPGYTPEGARAGRSSVLSSGNRWATVNPWEHAPIHLHQMLAPRLDAMGIDVAGAGYMCATTLLSLNRSAPAVDTLFAYPGEGMRLSLRGDGRGAARHAGPARRHPRRDQDRTVSAALLRRARPVSARPGAHDRGDARGARRPRRRRRGSSRRRGRSPPCAWIRRPRSTRTSAPTATARVRTSC